MSWSEAQRRMVALGYYTGRIDGDPGGDSSRTLTGVERLLDLVEEARGITRPPPPPPLPVIQGNFPLKAGFDPDYAWLGQIGTLPKILQEALKLYGLAEIKGSRHSDIIMGLAEETDLTNVYTSDEIAWCGLFIAAVVKRAGYAPVAGPLWALNWGTFGVKGPVAQLGDILTFVREGGGHVGLYIGEDANYYHVLGGNQGDRVSIIRIAKSRLRAIRRPQYRSPLPAWKPYMLAASGTVSTNEA